MELEYIRGKMEFLTRENGRKESHTDEGFGKTRRSNILDNGSKERGMAKVFHYQS